MPRPSPFGGIVVPQECDDTNHLRIRIGSRKERSWILLPRADTARHQQHPLIGTEGPFQLLQRFAKSGVTELIAVNSDPGRFCEPPPTLLD